MDVQIPVDYKNLSFIIHITDMFYSAGSPGTGPSYSCGGEPPDPAEAEVNTGYVELDGSVSNIIAITSEDIDVIMQMTNDNQSLLEDMLKDDTISDKVYEALVAYGENKAYEEQCAHYASKGLNIEED